MGEMKYDFDKIARDGKINGLLQAQVIVLEAARAYPNHRSVLQIVAEKIAGAIPREHNSPQDRSGLGSTQEKT